MLVFLTRGALRTGGIVKNRYDVTVLRALNPSYIYLFFRKNGIQAWSGLGGCVLCITGNLNSIFGCDCHEVSNRYHFYLTSLISQIVVVLCTIIPSIDHCCIISMIHFLLFCLLQLIPLVLS